MNSVASLANSNGGGSCVQHAQSSSSSGSRRGEQRDYVNQPASGGHHHHHHHHHASQQGRDIAAHQKHRRTQKRVTHNEKRYHSGNEQMWGSNAQFFYCLLDACLFVLCVLSIITVDRTKILVFGF